MKFIQHCSGIPKRLIQDNFLDEEFDPCYISNKNEKEDNWVTPLICRNGKYYIDYNDVEIDDKGNYVLKQRG